MITKIRDFIDRVRWGNVACLVIVVGAWVVTIALCVKVVTGR